VTCDLGAYSESPPKNTPMVRPQVRLLSCSWIHLCADTVSVLLLQFGEPEGSLYVLLGVTRKATLADLRAAFRVAARTSHPDKGGDARAFAAVRHAYEVRVLDVKHSNSHTNSTESHAHTLRRRQKQTLSDPAARAAYDDLGFDPKYKPCVTQLARDWWGLGGVVSAGCVVRRNLARTASVCLTMRAPQV